MAAEKTSTRTTYHVLRELDAAGVKTYEPVAANVVAHSAEHAIRSYAATAGDQAPGTYVAVPSSRWKPTTITVETKTVVRLDAAKTTET